MTAVAEKVGTATTAETTAVRAPGTHRTRADALRNRERIVAAAHEMFVEYGPVAPLDEIARRAGIGNATLYRHFPDRGALIHAVLLSVVTRTADHAEAAAAAAAAGADPCAALDRFAHAAVDDNVGALCGLIVNGDDSRSAELGTQTQRLDVALEELMGRGRRDGRLRADVTVNDLMVAISRLSRPLPGVECQGADLHRHLQLFLDGLKIHDTAPAGTPDQPGDTTTRTR